MRSQELLCGFTGRRECSCVLRDCASTLNSIFYREYAILGKGADRSVTGRRESFLCAGRSSVFFFKMPHDGKRDRCRTGFSNDGTCPCGRPAAWWEALVNRTTEAGNGVGEPRLMASNAMGRGATVVRRIGAGYRVRSYQSPRGAGHCVRQGCTQLNRSALRSGKSSDGSFVHYSVGQRRWHQACGLRIARREGAMRGQ